jgi:hypothetical protein
MVLLGLLLVLALAGLGIFVGLLIGGSVLRFVASFVGVEGIALRNAMLTYFLAGLASGAASVIIVLGGWKEPFSLWILGVVIQGTVIRSRFCTPLTVGLIIAVVVTLIWLVTGLALAAVGRAVVPGYMTEVFG